ncbi:protein Mpa43p [[Candida] jaroonii]|uniref:Protein Mpa43p n=1 Tax=[Candida] jaroonii TaxID=467808 RepID=A0ACA9YGH3_9ASCO|nr:protein Mpa43p [[Candida] jaroonii]
MHCGIDIGTGSVRSYHEDGFSDVRETITTKHNNRVITQSSKQIFDSILEIVKNPTSICFTATCSMVVKQLIEKDGIKYLAPFNCGLNADQDQDIILWMDNRAVEQAKQLNKHLSGSGIKQTISEFIPELGLPKLKWLSDNYGQIGEFGEVGGLYCFELYDWFNYVFQIGYVENLVEFKLHNLIYEEGQGIDGSIKGWKKSDIATLQLKPNVFIAAAESVTKRPKKLMSLGEIVGESSIFPCLIRHGCIDSYGGWVSSLTDMPNVVSMIAGTSTCFIHQSETASVKGIWGPFELIEGKRVFASGQPATGKLLEDLFQEYRHLEPSFELVETATQDLEKLHSTSINEMIKNYFYYGDKYGNRTPLNNFQMNQMFIDGVNSNDLLGSVFTNNLESLIIKYNLILEFLAFQTHQIFSLFEDIEGITIIGSQAENSRFLSLLQFVTGKDIYIIKDNNHGLNVAKGAMKIASGDGFHNKYQKLSFTPSHSQQKVLDIKKKTIDAFITLQQKLNNIYE